MQAAIKFPYLQSNGGWGIVPTSVIEHTVIINVGPAGKDIIIGTPVVKN